MGLNRMMMTKKKGQTKQLYHLKSSYVQIEVQDTHAIILGYCAEEIQDDFLGTIPPMGSLSPNEYCGTKIKNILISINLNQGVGYFGPVDFYGKLPENAVGDHALLDFEIPQVGLYVGLSTSYNESTNTTSCSSLFDGDYFVFDGIDSLENLYLTFAPHIDPIVNERNT